MKKRTKKIILGCSGALVLLISSFIIYVAYFIYTLPPLFGEEQEHKPDEVLIANFYEHQVQFEQLREMVIRDDLMTRVDDNWTDPTNLPSDHIAEYRRLFKIVETPRGIIAPRDRDRIEFIASAKGWVASGSMKGYLYLKDRPRRLVESLDSYGWHTPRDVTVIRHIEGNWYLFFERS